ncbi:hypothetical protein ACROYT_G030255 [Oculina patagonica]
MLTNESRGNSTSGRRGLSDLRRERERERARERRRHSSKEQRAKEQERAREQRQRSSEGQRQNERERARQKRQNSSNGSEQRLQNERERARQKRQNSSEQQRQRERERARQKRQESSEEQREKERQRKRVPKQNERRIGECVVQQQLCDAEKLHRSKDLQRIALDEGFIISDNQGLGNCMFFALAEQLEIVKGVKISAEELRVNLVKFLTENSNLPNGTHLFRFVDHDRHPTWRDYLESMAKDGTWGDHLMLQAAANYYSTAIRVVSSLGRENESLICPVNPSDILPNTSNTNHQQPLVLGYIFELHYVSLLPIQVRENRNSRGAVNVCDDEGE